MSVVFLNFFSPADEICIQERNRTEKTEDIVDPDCSSQVGQSDCTCENTNVLEDTSITLPDDDACGL